MTEAAPDKVQIKYTQQYRELKQILLAKHFAGKGIASCHIKLALYLEIIVGDGWNCTGQGVQKKVHVDGLEIVFTEGPPLKKFVTPPKLSEDLAK